MAVAWQSVDEAAAALQLSSVRVRQMAADGSLRAQRVGGRWLVDAADVEARRQRPPTAGRPVTSQTGWLLLAALGGVTVELGRIDADGWSPAVVVETMRKLRAAETRSVESGRGLVIGRASQLLSESKLPRSTRDSLRRRLRNLIAHPPDVRVWDRWLSRRAQSQRFWVHPGVAPRLQDERRLAVGGAWAVAAHGGDLSPAGGLEAYVREPDLLAMVRSYRLRKDAQGDLVLRVIPDDVPDPLAPRKGQAVGQIVAAVDLLESNDERSQSLARAWLGAAATVLRPQSGARGSSGAPGR